MPLPLSISGVMLPVDLSIVYELFSPVLMSKSMTDVSSCLAALTEENKSYFRSSTTVISRFPFMLPFSMY
jgi:hypothetical protein